MNNRYYLFVLLTMTALESYGSDGNRWYTPYANSAKSWWNNKTTSQDVTFSFKDRLKSIAKRIDDARERLAIKGLSHSENVSYIDTEDVSKLKNRRDAKELDKVLERYKPSSEIIRTIEAHGPYERGEKYFLQGRACIIKGKN